MMQEQTKQKATRKLKGLDFSSPTSAVALVGPAVGGPANNIPILLAKSMNYSPAVIKKMQQIQVTMELPAFLEKFFGLYGSDAEVLARLMGYVKPEDESEEEYEDWWENYIEEKLSAFTIIKSLHESDNLAEALSKLTEDQYLDVLNDQEYVEKAMKKLEDGSKESETNTSTTVEKQKVEVSASKKTKKGKDMTQETEMVTKETFVAVEKAAQETKVALEKALKQLADIEEAQKAAIVKSKTDALKAVVKDEKQAAVVLKAALALDAQEDFDALIEVFKAQNALIEKSAMFQEVGASGDATEDANKESTLVKAIKSKYPQSK